MKKNIAILFSSMMVAALSACSAGDDSTISSPRMGSYIDSYCTLYTQVMNTSQGTVYKCEETGNLIICSGSECESYSN